MVRLEITAESSACGGDTESSACANGWGWLNNLADLGFWLGKDIFGFFKNIDLDNS